MQEQELPTPRGADLARAAQCPGATRVVYHAHEAGVVQQTSQVESSRATGLWEERAQAGEDPLALPVLPTASTRSSLPESGP